MSLLRLLARVVRSFSVLNRVVRLCSSRFYRVFGENHYHGDVSPVRYEALEARQLFSNYVVDTTVNVIDAEDGMTSLREAIVAANDNVGLDVIDFDSDVFAGGGTITLGGTELEITDDLVINGLDGLVIDADQQSRVFHIHGEIDVEMSELTITGGVAQEEVHGAGILVHDGASLTLNASVVKDNQIVRALVNATNVKICDFKHGDVSGAGISVLNGDLKLNQVEVIGNGHMDARNGAAGIFVQGSDVVVSNSTFSRSGYDGIYSLESNVKMLNSTLNDNTRGLVLFDSVAELHHVTINGNQRAATIIDSDAMLQDVTISGNRWGGAGGLQIRGSEVDLRRITVTGNSAYLGRGGIIIEDSDVAMHNSIVVANQSGHSASFDISGHLNAASSHNFIGSLDNSGGLIDGVNSNVIGVDGMDVDSASLILDPVLKDNGGAAMTHALVPDSPANDAGSLAGIAYSVDEETVLSVNAENGVLANDNDGESEFAAVLNEDVSSGTLVLNADGSFIYTPDPNFSGVDGFTYRADDGTDGAVSVITVTILVNPAYETGPASAWFSDIYSVRDLTVATDPKNGDIAGYIFERSTWDTRLSLSDDACGRFRLEQIHSGSREYYEYQLVVADADRITAQEYTIDIEGYDRDGRRHTKVFSVEVTPDHQAILLVEASRWKDYPYLLGLYQTEELSVSEDATEGDWVGTLDFETSHFESIQLINDADGRFRLEALVSGGGDGPPYAIVVNDASKLDFHENTEHEIVIETVQSGLMHRRTFVVDVEDALQDKAYRMLPYIGHSGSHLPQAPVVFESQEEVDAWGHPQITTTGRYDDGNEQERERFQAAIAHAEIDFENEVLVRLVNVESSISNNWWYDIDYEEGVLSFQRDGQDRGNPKLMAIGVYEHFFVVNRSLVSKVTHKEVTVEVPNADLVGVLSPISLLRSIQSGAAFKGAVRVRMPNRGDLKMNGPVSLRLVAKSLAGGEDLLLAQKAVRGQAVIGGVLRFYLPDGLSPGDYQLIAEAEGQDVDGRRVVLQAGEDNRGEKLNVVAHDMAFLDWKGSLTLVDIDDARIGREQLNRKLKSRSSLRMQRRYDGHLPERLQNKLGHRVPLHLRLENVGTLAAGRGNVSYRVLLVNDAQGIKSRKVASGKINVSNMKAGASFSKLIYARLPSDLQNGDYQFSLRLMPDEQFEESNPDGSSVTNNRIDLQQYITVGDPVYIKTRLVQGFTRGREVAGPIRDVIQFNVSNQGDGILKDEVFDMFVTVRRDSRVVATQLIENHVIPELSPGAAVASEVQLNVTGLPIGRYYFEFELRPRDFHSNRYVEDRTFTAYLSC